MFLPPGLSTDSFAQVREPTVSPSLGHVILRCDTTLYGPVLIVGAFCDGFMHRGVAFVSV